MLLIGITVILFLSCKKDIVCDDAQLCMVNKTNDTIYYCWGCNIYRDTLLPGARTCENVGPVSVSSSLSSSSSSIVWVDFSSSAGSYLIKVDECYIELPLE